MAMRGSRPGERRGGRQKGTPNKKTAYVRAVMAARSTGPNVSPLDVMLAVMRDPHVALDLRVKMALKALPRQHRKLPAGESVSVAGDGRLPIGPRKEFPTEAQHRNASSLGTTAVNEVIETMSSGTTESEEGSRSVGAAPVLSADVRGPKTDVFTALT